MAEEGIPQVGEDPFADPSRQVRLRIAHPPVDEAEEEERADDPPEPAEIVTANPVIDGVLRQERWNERGRGRREQGNDRERGPDLVRARQPCEGSDAAPRARPRPVVDLGVTLPD